MSLLTYNGITLSILHTRLISRQAIFSEDGLVFRHWRWTFDVDCVYNPAATSYRLPGNNTANVPIATSGLYPTVTDAAIRQRLAQNRGKLIYQTRNASNTGYDTLLSSPPLVSLTQYACDATGGPYVESCHITEIHGDRTFSVSLRIVTDVAESPVVQVGGTQLRAGAAGPGPGLPVLLSHQFRRWADVDEHHYAEVIQEGVAYFHIGELVRRGSIPDFYRASLFPLCPPNFKRVSIRVVQTEAPNGIHYRVIDKELAFNTPAANTCTRIEAYHQKIVSAPWPGTGMAQAVVPAVQGFFGRRGRFQPGAGMGGLAGVGASLILSNLPHYTVRVWCKAWGNRSSTRARLQSLVLGVINTRLQRFPVQVSTLASLTHILHEKTVEADITNTYPAGNPPVRGYADGAPWPPPGGGAAPDPVDVFEDFPGDNTGAALNQNPLAANAPSNNFAPPGSAGNRGTWLGQLMAQGLTAAGTLPAVPSVANFNNATDLSL